MMHKDFDHGTTLRPAIEHKMLRTMSERVLDGGLQILPLAIAQVIRAIGTVRGTYIVAIGDREQWQAKLCQRRKDAQSFVARGPTTMHENSPCAELARHIPG